MDKLSIFAKESGEVKLTSIGGNTLDTVVDELKDIRREQQMTRMGLEAMTWGEQVLDNEDVEVAEIPEKEIDDA